MLKRIIIASVLMIVLAFLPVTDILKFALYMVPYLVIGHDILRKAFLGVKNKQMFDESFLMAVATVGAIILGVARPAGAEFSFFLAIPTMLGASLLKVLKYGKEILEGVAAMPTGTEIIVLLVGCAVSFIVSVLVIKGLMEYVRKRSFAAFGVYRIILGAVVIAYFIVKSLIG